MEKIKIIGHRGYRTNYPENTQLSFTKSFEICDGIECDIQKTKDGKFIVIHDDSVDRTSNKNGKVKELELAKIKNMDFGEGENILELKELLQSIPPNKMINIELKEETITNKDCDEITNIIKKHSTTQNLLISSFCYKLLDDYKERGFPVGLLIGHLTRYKGILKLLRVIKKLNPDYLNLPIEIYKLFGPIFANIIVSLFKKKYKFIFWTVNTKKQFNWARKWAEVIITDNVELIMNCLNELKR